jgi:hypothetical protein
MVNGPPQTNLAFLESVCIGDAAKLGVSNNGMNQAFMSVEQEFHALQAARPSAKEK